jgi:hypothetical protein
MGPSPLEGNAVRKFETRNSKFEANSKSKVRKFEFVSNFLTSVVLLTKEVGFRISSFVWLVAFFLAVGAHASVDLSSNRATVIIVVGAPGEEEFGSNFVRQASLWQKASEQANLHQITIGLRTAAVSETSRSNSESSTSATNDYEDLKQVLLLEPKEGSSELYLVLIGHGTFDSKEARFNLRGPDVSATELATWLQPFRRPIAVIDTSSSSAPFLNKLSATNRVIITATRSGNEQNFTRFGQYFAEAITSPDADLDKDGQVSLLEAFLIASRRTTEFYKVEGRIATEHALLDDNGDGLGTQADWFRGLRAVKAPKEKAAVDGTFAQQFHVVRSYAENRLTEVQRKKRDEIEHAVFRHREKKGKIPEDQYYRDLEKMLLELARLYETNSASVNPSNVSPTAKSN